MWVYINYPNPHFTIHNNPNCSMIQMHGKSSQRVMRFDIDNLSLQLSDFIEKKIRFASKRDLNDLWLEINLDSHVQEVSLVHVLQALLAKRYDPLRYAPNEDSHC